MSSRRQLDQAPNSHDTLHEDLHYSEHEIQKLRQKYSPKKNLSPPKRGPVESLKNQYKIFAVSPRRRSSPNEFIDINEEKRMRITQPNINTHPDQPEAPLRHTQTHSKGKYSDEKLSPIRRSGSPLRRQKIRNYENHAKSLEDKVKDINGESTSRVGESRPIKNKVMFKEEKHASTNFVDRSEEHGTDFSEVKSLHLTNRDLLEMILKRIEDLESRICNIENIQEDLKVAMEYNTITIDLKNKLDQVDEALQSILPNKDSELEN